MESDGFLQPQDPADAREAYESLEPTARIVVTETLKAMDLGVDDFRDLITDEALTTAQNALFASLLRVHHAPKEEFETWRDGTDREFEMLGSEHVDNRTWHVFMDRGIVATYQNEPAAAQATLRRVVFGKLYRDLLTSSAE